MCNLNVFVKSEREMKGKEFDSFLSAFLCACSNSFINNNDGDGYYFSDSDELVKSENKVNLVDYKKKMLRSKFILGHQRLTTHGQGKKYIHPFDSKEFALIHNGILSSFAENGHSDTYMFFNQFIELFEGSVYEGKSREERIVDTIKKLLDDEIGSYSIALYDKVMGKLFYFKENVMSINFFLRDNKKSLFITTNRDNGGYFNMYGEFNFEKKPIQDHIIYEIGFNNRDEIYIIGMGEIEGGYTWYGETGGWDNTGSFKKASELEDVINADDDWEDEGVSMVKDNMGVYPVRNARSCYFCGKATHNFDPHQQMFLCDKCIFGNRHIKDYMEDMERGYYTAD